MLNLKGLGVNFYISLNEFLGKRIFLLCKKIYYSLGGTEKKILKNKFDRHLLSPIKSIIKVSKICERA
jgi:hypothetical protein